MPQSGHWDDRGRIHISFHHQNYLVSDRESYKTPLGMVLKLSLLKPTGSVTVDHATLTRV